jgi:uroporphyrinogen III methyltransferase / synthase
VLAGKRVLITRPRREAEAMARELRARDAEPIVAPTISIGPPDDEIPARKAVQELDRYDWVVFTSRPGVDAFFRNLKDAGDLRALAHLKFGAVGPKTAERLQSYGVSADLVSGRFTSDDAAAELLARTNEGERVLIYAAQDNRDILRSELAKAARRPTAVAAYATQLVHDPEFEQRVREADVLTFTSGSTVRGFLAAFTSSSAAVEAANAKVVACIGPITADEANEAGLRVDVVPDEFTTQALIAALEEYFKNR